MRFGLSLNAPAACFALLLTGATALVAAETASDKKAADGLPFAPEVISRLSLDGKPRSLSIRQGSDVWLGYDLERATLLKAWQAPAGKPGLIKAGFATRSTGITWFEDGSNAAWELRRGEAIGPLAVRYLGCSHRGDHIELRWELRRAAGASPVGGTLKLFERVPLSANRQPAAAGTATGRVVNEGRAVRVVRELRVEGLAAEEALLPPATVRRGWQLALDLDLGGAETKAERPATGGERSVRGEASLRGNEWHRLVLP